MISTKRPRGRPRGSGIDDTPALIQVAELLVRDASLKTPTTAMKRIISRRKDWGASDETILRRWQEKWRRRSGALLAAARERARPKQSPAMSSLAQLVENARLAATYRPAIDEALTASRASLEQMNADIARAAAAFRPIMIDPALVRAASEWGEALKASLDLPEIKKWAELARSVEEAAQGFKIPKATLEALEGFRLQQSEWQEIGRRLSAQTRVLS